MSVTSSLPLSLPASVRPSLPPVCGLAFMSPSDLPVSLSPSPSGPGAARFSAALPSSGRRRSGGLGWPRRRQPGRLAPAGAQPTAVGGRGHGGGGLEQTERSAASPGRVPESPAEGERVREAGKTRLLVLSAGTARGRTVRET